MTKQRLDAKGVSLIDTPTNGGCTASYIKYPVLLAKRNS